MEKIIFIMTFINFIGFVKKKFIQLLLQHRFYLLKDLIKKQIK
jgi:hypothetical protein